MTESKPVGRLVVASLVLSRVVAQPSSLITGLLLIEIAKTFNVPLGVAGLLSTSSSILVVLGSLSMSYLSMRVNHKALLVAGLALYCFSYLGSFLAPAFPLLLVSFSLLGVARSMVDPMASSYVGRLLPPGRRAGIISLFFAGMAAVVIVGSPFIGYISGLWGWRILFILFALPLSAAALTLAWFAIPSTPRESSSNPRNSLRGCFRKITANRSALACIACVLLSEATWSVTLVYGISFIRQRFAMLAGDASYLLIGTSLCFMAGSLSGGRLVNRLGRKRLAVLSTLALGTLTLLYFNLGVFWASAAALLLACGTSAMRYTVSESLVLEQVPDLRGTVMSLNSIALGLGATVGSSLGGFTLISLGFGGLGAFGVLSLTASLLYSVFAVDPVTP